MLEREITLEITRKEAPFAPEEEIGTYVVQRWTWRQKQQAIISASTLLDDKTGLASIDIVGYEIYQMLACIKQAPEGLDLIFDRFSGREAKEAMGKEPAVEAIEGLDADVGTLLLTACRKVNGLNEADIRDFLSRTEQDEKAAIPG